MAKKVYLTFVIFFLGLTSCSTKNSSEITTSPQNNLQIIEDIDAEQYLEQNYTTSNFEELLTSLFPNQVNDKNIKNYSNEIQNLLEYFPDQSSRTFFFAEKNLKISLKIEKSFSIMANSLKYCREFSQEFIYYDLNFAHQGLSCRNEQGTWHLLKRKF